MDEVIGCEVCHRAIFKEHGPICCFCVKPEALEVAVTEQPTEATEETTVEESSEDDGEPDSSNRKSGRYGR